MWQMALFAYQDAEKLDWNRAQYHKTLLLLQHNLLRRSMRGKDEQQLDVFSYVSAEQRAARSPLASSSCHDR